jgi:hypothetical protein
MPGDIITSIVKFYRRGKEENMELIDELVKKLGVSKDVAKGGAGLLFKLVQDKWAAEDFGKLSGAVPEINDLIRSAPESGGIMGGLGKLASGPGSGASGLTNLASLEGGLSKLGIDRGATGKFFL